MAGALTISTLNNDTGVLATQNGMNGIAKAWVNFNGTGTVAIRESMNVSSITDNGTGNYTINFTTAMPNANYSAVLGGGAGGANSDVVVQEAYGGGTLRSTTQLKVFSVNGTFSFYDAAFVSVSIFSS